MIGLIEQLFFVSAAVALIGGAGVLLATFGIATLRKSLLMGLPMAIIGFVLGATAGGGFGQTEGWGFGNLGALLLGVLGASAGLMLGVGIFGLAARRKITASICLPLGIIFPLAAALNVWVKPRLVAHAFDHWRQVLDTQDAKEAARFRGAGLADITINQIKDYARGVPPERWSDSFFDILWEQGLVGLDYKPLPKRIAHKAVEHGEFRGLLAANDSVPPEVLGEIVRSLNFSDHRDANVIRLLAWNKALAKEDARFLREKLLDIQKDPTADSFMRSEAESSLSVLRRREEASWTLWEPN